MDLILPQRIQKGLNLPQITNIHASLPKSTTKPPWPKRPQSTIKEIVVHHSGDVASIQNEAKYHINSRGWYTISYHVSIDNGNILQLNDLLDVTSQAKGANAYSIGVCINWNLNLRPPTEFEYNALIGVILSIKELFPDIKVSGHKEIGKRYGYGTACPVISMDKLRSDILSTEEKLEYIDSPSSNRAICYAFAERIEALGSRFADKKYGEYAKSLVMRLEPILGELGYAGDVAPEGVVKRVIEIYKNTHNTRFEGEAFKKLTSGAKFAQDNGIMPS